MKLFPALFRRKYMPPGHIHRGKRRIVQEVKPEDLRQLKDRFEIEEKNMFFLRHSFLSPEQSHGHARALGKNEQNYLKTVRKDRPFYENHHQ
ncbi:hypothetical protein GWI33_008078 [Rhynchophorus ferrugineus]|uniref:Ribosomal protein 63, mitochondrial n=1 Tax=Rhynchophorus ferrugineus TaxID=354439 RepID=A0A834MEF6_RHYFE|nr:hypothetical protein GWI33_008078 [Rhynchophorus ferrugineus]